MRKRMKTCMVGLLALLLSLQSFLMPVLNVQALGEQIAEGRIMETVESQTKEPETKTSETEKQITENSEAEEPEIKESESGGQIVETEELSETEAVDLNDAAETVIKSRAKGDVTIKVDGEVRVNYTTIGVDDTKTLTISVEDEIITNIKWSSENSAIISVNGDKDGATVQSYRTGVVDIIAKIETNDNTYTTEITITARKAINPSVGGYAKKDMELQRAAQESAVSDHITKNDPLVIRAECGNYYWVEYNGGTGFVLKENVVVPATDIELDSEYTAIEADKQSTVKAQITPSIYTGETAWSSNTSSVATVNGSGMIIGNKEGTAIVSASVDTMNGTSKASTIVSIWSKLTGVSAITLNSVNTQMGATFDSASGGMLAAGTQVTILGQCGSYYYIKLIDNRQVFVLKTAVKIPVTSITLDKKEITIGVGAKYQLTAAMKPDIATDKNLAWSSKNSGVAKVDKRGNVTGTKQGYTYIEAKTADGKIAAQCKVFVKKDQIVQTDPISSLVINKITPGYRQINLQFTAKGKRNQDALCQIVIYDSSGKRFMKAFDVDVKTNVKRDYIMGGMERGETYYIIITTSYQTSEGMKTKKSKKYKFKMKKAEKTTTVGVSLNSKKTKITVTWKKVNKVKGYEVYRSLNNLEKGELLKRVDKNTTKFVENTKRLKSGKTYYYKVVPFWTENKKTKFGSSNRAKVKYKK